ncbi:MAG: hypothetical protein H8F28_24095 [Fibrella sp.]|nr:hypothetical protein [Armatimonadota bacterium]
MTTIKGLRGAGFAVMSLSLASLASGCGDDSGGANNAVRSEVEKNTATAASTGTSPYGKVSNETKLPPQGKPPEPGADMSKRGPAGGRPAQ